MYKVIIWGIGDIYNECKNNIDFEVLKNNINIEAIVSNDKYADIVDGKKVIDKSEITDYSYDYIIVFVRNFENVKDEILSLGIERSKIIDGSVLKIPCFDFKRYASLIEEPVTIVSDDCWAGNIYKYLKLKSTSPFRNFYILGRDYIKLCNNLEYYLSQPLILEREADLYEGHFPIGSLGNDDKKIFFNFNHYRSFEEAELNWDKRKDRVNFNRLLIKMSVPLSTMFKCDGSDELVKSFSKLPFKNKICFSLSKSEDKRVFATKRYLMHLDEIEDFVAIGPMFREMTFCLKQIDIFKLLCGEEDFIREY